jgi:outer membrane protein TolC
MEALSLSVDLYKQGLSAFQTVVDAQRSVLTYENAYVEAQTTALVDLVQLYQALGGGW